MDKRELKRDEELIKKIGLLKKEIIILSLLPLIEGEEIETRREAVAKATPSILTQCQEFIGLACR